MNKDDLIGLYRKLLLIRLTEETIAEKYGEQKMRCPTHFSIGQEAVAAGVCHNLSLTDLVYSTHRCHAHYLAKGGDLKKMVAELYGKVTGCSGGKGGSQHLIDLAAGFAGATPIVGSILPVAVGAAFTKKFNKEKGLVVVFFGEAATEEGVFAECINFSVLHRLPILFICENNLYSVYTPLRERQPVSRDIIKLVRANGLVAKKSDGSNPLTVNSIIKRFIPKARQGQPVFLEFSTYRWLEHCGPNRDDDLGYRNPKEVEKWRKRDSVKLMEGQLFKKKVISEKEMRQMKKEIKKEINSAFAFAERSRFPARKNLYENIYQQ